MKKTFAVKKKRKELSSFESSKWAWCTEAVASRKRNERLILVNIYRVYSTYYIVLYRYTTPLSRGDIRCGGYFYCKTGVDPLSV